MALNWQWNEDHIGKVYHNHNLRGTYTNDLYTGNCLMIEIHRNDNEYYLHSFFADEEHGKNCLGLNKGHENIYTAGTDDEMVWEIWEMKDKWQMQKVDKLLKLLIKARMNVHFIPLRDRVSESEGGEN